MLAPASWYLPLLSSQSRGSRAARPQSLAGLVEARQQHLSQFFSPIDLTRYMWMIVRGALEEAQQREQQLVSLLDNSVGSGRMFAFADPALHALYGVDVDAQCVEPLSRVASEAGFTCEFHVASLEGIRPRGFHAALINPPFSIPLQSPLLEALPCTAFGRFGPHTSAPSHMYALDQALVAARIVVAVLPTSVVPLLRADRQTYSRLAALLRCPARTFAEENTDVDVTLAVFDHAPRAHVVDAQLRSFDEVPNLALSCPLVHGRPRLRLRDIEDSTPTITLPVTGDRAVRVTRNLRRIVLKYRCGLTQAKVHNALLRSRLPPRAEHRYPRSAVYDGQGILDIEVHLAQPDPLGSLDQLCTSIRRAGGEPVIDTGLLGYLRRRIRRLARERVPLRHWVYAEQTVQCGTSLEARAKRTHVADATAWGSPIIKSGELVRFARDGDHYAMQVRGRTYRLSLEEIRARFEICNSGAADWVLIHEGRLSAFPQLAHAWRARARGLGIDRWLSWDYQLEDAIESLIAPGGELLCWEQGLGKARLAIALCLLTGCKHGLIAVEAYLVDEMERELKTLPIDRDSWQIIRSPSDVRSLRTVNVISYNRLRAPLHHAHARRTYARALRRRVSVMIADEGSLLSHLDTQQTRAAYMVSARRRFVLDGTPIGNYPRDLLALLAWSKGEAKVTQPYGYQHPYIEPGLLQTMVNSVRGVDRFREDFVVMEWVTNEFAEELTEGAKREIPQIANLAKYRALLAPHLKRRLGVEPEVARCVQIPQPTITDHVIEWDEPHLAHYLTIAEEFRSWYLEQRRRAGHCARTSNLVALLARIQAVLLAANAPHMRHGQAAVYSPLTSKQRAVIARLIELSHAGHKTVLFATNPATLDRIAAELARRNFECVLAHGGIAIAERTREINRRFRDGDTSILLASFGCAAKGLNLWQADRALFYDRRWTARLESQAARRLCRPQQQRSVVVERYGLAGSIDQYMAMLTAFKSDTARAGIDWAAPELDIDDFAHLDTVLGRFCEELAALRGLQRHELRAALAN